MRKLKVKNLNEAKLEKLHSIFGKDVIEDDKGIYLMFEASDTEIKIGSVVAEYKKTVTSIKGYELIKDITIEVKCEKYNVSFVMHWLQEGDVVWIAHRLVNSLISVPRSSRTGSGLTAEQKQLLKEEIARYKASKKNA